MSDNSAGQTVKQFFGKAKIEKMMLEIGHLAKLNGQPSSGIGRY